MDEFKNPNELFKCVFGCQCASKNVNTAEGPEICLYCKNLSTNVLGERAQNHPNRSVIDSLIKTHRSELNNQKRDGRLCVTKDPYYRLEPYYFNDFDPESYGPCGTVDAPGKLCHRCYRKAQQIPYFRLEERFDGDKLGFPCVFRDPKYTTESPEPLIEPGWQFLKDLEEIDPQTRKAEPLKGWYPPEGYCLRTTRRGRLCQKCFVRLFEGFDQFSKCFDQNGSLRPNWDTRGMN